MAKATIEGGLYFMWDVYLEVEEMFGAMMRGEDMTSELQSYLPIKRERYNGDGRLRYNYPEWKESIWNILRSDESSKGNTKYRKK